MENERRWAVLSHDEDGTNIVDDGLTEQEAKDLKKKEEDKLRNTFGMEGNFEVVEWDDY